LYLVFFGLKCIELGRWSVASAEVEVVSYIISLFQI